MELLNMLYTRTNFSNIPSYFLLKIILVGIATGYGLDDRGV
jgi:hypothetical protein